MLLVREVYFIMTKERPIEFHMGNGNMGCDFTDAEQYITKEQAEKELSEFDEPENYEILKGSVSTEI